MITTRRISIGLDPSATLASSVKIFKPSGSLRGRAGLRSAFSLPEEE